MNKQCSTWLNGVHKPPRKQFYPLLTWQNQDRLPRYAGVSFLKQKGSIDYLRAFYYEQHSDY